MTLKVKDLSEGDTCSIKLTVQSIVAAGVYCTNSVFLYGDVEIEKIYPRPLKVGDIVNNGGIVKYILLCIDGDQAFIRRLSAYPNHYMVEVRNLTLDNPSNS